MTSSGEAKPKRSLGGRIRRSLSAKLLILTIVFILIAEILVLIPSIAYRRREWLEARIEAAYLVGLALEAPEAEMIGPESIDSLFATAGILGVMFAEGGASLQVFAPDIDYSSPPPVRFVDLRTANAATLAADAWASFFSHGDDWIRVVGEPDYAPGKTVDIIVSQRALRVALRRFSGNILLISLVIASITAGLVYAALDRIIVGPVRRLSRQMSVFQARPEEAAIVIRPSARGDEIGAAERSLRDLEVRIQALLSQRRRLAALGAGVSKITHDLRNILASAQLMSDRLAASNDPRVQKLSPRLIQSLDRAIALSRDALAYARMEPAALVRSRFELAPLIGEVLEDAASPHADFTTEVPEALVVEADRNQLYRAILNLVRNSVEAFAPEEDVAPAKRGRVAVRAQRTEGSVRIEIEDDGPGVPEAARDALFEPFAGSTKPGGSGLGAAIAHEILAAHNGSLTLERTGPAGSLFAMILPQN